MSTLIFFLFPWYCIVDTAITSCSHYSEMTGISLASMWQWEHNFFIDDLNTTTSMDGLRRKRERLFNFNAFTFDKKRDLKNFRKASFLL